MPDIIGLTEAARRSIVPYIVERAAAPTLNGIDFGMGGRTDVDA